MLSVNVAEGWWKWGQPEKRKSLTDYPKFKTYLEQLWNRKLDNKIQVPRAFPVKADENRSKEIIRIFSDNFPSLKISGEPSIRLKRSVSKGYPDLLASANGSPIEIADAVLFPQTHEEVLQILKISSEHKIIIIPFGGGTNVVGSLKIAPDITAPRIVLDLSQMNHLIEMDPVNHTATFQAGIFGPTVESLLNEKGFTLGHFPQSFEFSSLGGWIVTRSAGQESSFYGRIEDIVISLRIALPGGTVDAGNYEGDAEGINIKSLFFGSEGMLGVITEARVRIHRLPDKKKWVSVLFPEFEKGLGALKGLIQSGIFPSVVRYSDEQETFLLSLLTHEQHSSGYKIKSAFKKAILRWKSLFQPCLMMIRIDGIREDVESRRGVAMRVFKKHGGFYVGERPGKKWESTRFNLPYLQDDLIEHGIFVDTVETVLPWSRISEVRSKMYNVLRASDDFKRERGILLAHVSHVYGSSASIYFTMITEQDQSRAYEQWKNIKTLAIDTIVDNGGAVSHHHSIGTDLRKWYLQKTDSFTRNILQGVKKTIDPDHILSPGKLFDD